MIGIRVELMSESVEEVDRCSGGTKKKSSSRHRVARRRDFVQDSRVEVSGTMRVVVLRIRCEGESCRVGLRIGNDSRKLTNVRLEKFRTRTCSSFLHALKYLSTHT